jgi:hypothetical protein
MTASADPSKRKATFPRKPKPETDEAASEPAPAARVSLQFGPTKSAPGSRLKGGK